MNHIGRRIRYLRKSKNMTQRELGHILGVKKAAIQKYETSADPNLSADKIRILSDTFDVFSRVFVYQDDSDLWSKVYEFWESESQNMRSSLPHQSLDNLPEEYAGLKKLENKVGRNHLGMLVAMMELNTAGFEKVKAYTCDLLKIDEYRR